MRRLLAPSFTQQSLRGQAPVLEMYADKVVNRLKSLLHEAGSQKGETVVINFLDWSNFYTMDIIGDLGLLNPI
jgi:cytochrome P450